MAAIAPTEAETAVRGRFTEIQAGRLGVRLAESADDVLACQQLRYRVFVEELGAVVTQACHADRRDHDMFDDTADHLMVTDYGLDGTAAEIVGTYRLLRDTRVLGTTGFYSATEFDISPLLTFPGSKLELGRSCVARGYRNQSVMQLLWNGIAAYVFQHKIDLMFGCASLPGTEPDRLASELTYLYHSHLAPPALRVRPLPERRVEMLRVPPETVNARQTHMLLPPLVKGYLRLGAYVGDGAVIDRAFNTIDIAIIVKTDLIADKYYRHYDRRIRDALD